MSTPLKQPNYVLDEGGGPVLEYGLVLEYLRYINGDAACASKYLNFLVFMIFILWFFPIYTLIQHYTAIRHQRVLDMNFQKPYKLQVIKIVAIWYSSFL